MVAAEALWKRGTSQRQGSDKAASMAPNLCIWVQDAKKLRPILIEEVSVGLDLLLRDRLRKAYSLSMAQLQPRLPLIGALPTPPAPPVFVPGKGMMGAEAFVDAFFPKLTDEQEVLLDTQARFTNVFVSLRLHYYLLLVILHYPLHGENLFTQEHHQSSTSCNHFCSASDRYIAPKISTCEVELVLGFW